MGEAITGLVLENFMSAPESTSVQIVQRFAAAPKKLWHAWTDAAIVEQWFGSDPKGKVTSAKVDARIGGTFTVSFTDSDGTSHTCSGVYATVHPERELTFSWRWKSEPQTESFVSVLLLPHGNGTEMRFEHARLGTASQHDYLNGWKRTFAKLDRVLNRLT